MSNRKKVVVSFVLAVLMSVGAAGCGNGTVQTSQSPAESNQSSTVQSNSSTSEGHFDFDEVCKNIVINGKRYTFPFSVEELGEGYTIPDNVMYMNLKDGKIAAVADIVYGEYKLDVMFYELADESQKNRKYLKTQKVNNVSCFFNDFLDKGIPSDFFVLDGITYGSTIDDVRKKFGEPLPENIVYKLNSNKVGSYNYYTDDTKACGISIHFDSYGIVSYISIHNQLLKSLIS